MPQVLFNEIASNNFLLAPSTFKWAKINSLIENLKAKYKNLLDDFKSFDGFAFPSSDYVTHYTDLINKTPLIQIGNVNDDSWIVSRDQKFEYLPNKYLLSKSKFLK